MTGLAAAHSNLSWPGGGGRFLLDPLGDLGEIAGLAEVLVDAGEADVGDVVERLQAVHHRLADPRRS